MSILISLPYTEGPGRWKRKKKEKKKHKLRKKEVKLSLFVDNMSSAWSNQKESASKHPY